MAKTIEIIIDPKGDVSISLGGYNGQGCAAVMDALTKGQAVTSRLNKPEKYQPLSTNTNVLTR